MKRVRTALLLSATAAAAALVGCHRTGSNAGKDVSNPGQSAPVNTAQDVAAGPTGLVSAATVGGFTTKGFVDNAARGDMYEIAAGKIAVQRSKSPEVRKLAQMMINDHTRLSQTLKSTLASANVGVSAPTDLDQRRQGMIDNLKAAGDSDFDLAYLHQQLAAHLETITLMKGFQNHGDNDALKALAGKAAPVIQKHLDMIKQIGGDKLKGDPGARGDGATQQP